MKGNLAGEQTAGRFKINLARAIFSLHLGRFICVTSYTQAIIKSPITDLQFQI